VTAIEIRPVSGIDDLERWVALHNEIGPRQPGDRRLFDRRLGFAQAGGSIELHGPLLT
jgi:hypothetical protein